MNFKCWQRFIVLAAMVVVGTTDWCHTSDAEDLVPGPVHDHASHHPIVKAPHSSDARPGEHCYLCHWLRSFQNGLRASSTPWLTGAEIQHVQPIAIPAPHAAVATLLPARAPPV